MGFVPYTERHGYILNNMPPPHTRRLIKQAARQDTSAANVVGQILADRYGIEFEPSTRKQRQPLTDSTISLRLPGELFNAVEDEAVDRGITMRSVILDALSYAFKLKPPEPTPVPGKRPGRPRTYG